MVYWESSENDAKFPKSKDFMIHVIKNCLVYLGFSIIQKICEEREREVNSPRFNYIKRSLTRVPCDEWGSPDVFHKPSDWSSLSVYRPRRRWRPSGLPTYNSCTGKCLGKTVYKENLNWGN